MRKSSLTVSINKAKLNVQSEEIKRDPEKDKSALWAGSGCMAVFPISGSHLISPPGTYGLLVKGPISAD